MKAQLEHVHIAYTFLARLVPTCMLMSVLNNKISASELSQKFTHTNFNQQHTQCVVGWVVEHSGKNKSRVYMPVICKGILRHELSV